MCYKNYDEWVEYIEDKYSHREKQSHTGLKYWIETVDNEKIQNDIDRLSKMKYEGKSGNLYEDIILTAWAASFCPEYYDEKKKVTRKCYDVKNDIVIKGGKGSETRFNAAHRYGRELRNYFKGTPIPLDIPNDGRANDKPYYWMRIASALQKRYGIFKSLNELNDFVFSVGDMNNPKGIQNYGFYVRDIKELCLAYSILHGYSIEQYNDLYMRCQDTIKSERVSATTKGTRTEECKGYFENDLTANEALLSSDEELYECEMNFIDNVKMHADIFLKENDRKERFAHWTALKNVLFDFTNMLSSETVQKLGEGTKQIESEKTFQERVQTLWQNFARILDFNPDILKLELGKLFVEKNAPEDINDSYSEVLKKTLQGYLMKRLGLFEFCFLSNNISSLFKLHLDITDSERKRQKLERDIVTFQEELNWKMNNITKKYNISGEALSQFQEDYLKDYAKYYSAYEKYKAAKRRGDKTSKPTRPVPDLNKFKKEDDANFVKGINSFLYTVRQIFMTEIAMKKTEKNKESKINKSSMIQKAIKSVMDDSLRCILIVCIMKDGISEAWKSVDSVLGEINQKLIDNKFRGIDSTASPSNGEVYNEEKDLFDWIVAEAINLEFVEQQAKQREVISGYEMFRKYLLSGICSADAEMPLAE